MDHLLSSVDELETVEGIASLLHLVPDAEDATRLKLDAHGVRTLPRDRVLPTGALTRPDDVAELLEEFPRIAPESVRRPDGDTTFFTCAGVQRLETLHREGADIARQQFTVCQPVVRSQFLDRVREGVSTSFINVTAVVAHATYDDFRTLVERLGTIICAQGVEPEMLRFAIDEKPSVRWGDRKFRNLTITAYLHGVELGECVFIQDYPLDATRRMNVVDMGFGVERMNWGIHPERGYFPEFEELYNAHPDRARDQLTVLLDAVRSMTLIAREGVTPSQHDHGYRLRQFSKRFARMNHGAFASIDTAARIALEYWDRWSPPATVPTDLAVDIVQRENERNANSLFLTALRTHGQFDCYVEINQPTAQFLQQVEQSIPKDAFQRALRAIA